MFSLEPLMYCEEWLSQTAAFPLVKLPSQRISELLSSISLRERNFFYQQWMEKIQEEKYVALDITSISSYSQLIHGCEWGYNRDHEDLPQINLCMLFGEGSRFPIYQTSYHGSLKDVSTLRATLDEVTALAPGSNLRVVMDKGFFSSRNVDEMLSLKRPVHFLISVPFTSSFAKKLVESERHSIDRLGNTILTSDGAIRGVHKIRVWHTKSRHTKLHAYVYFNPVKAVKERNKLYAYVTELRKEALHDPGQTCLQDEFRKYLSIRKSASDPNGHTVTVKEDVIEDKLRTCGWMVLLSDTVADPQEALDIYRTKDVVEKSFDRLKNTLDLNRLRVHNDERMENKLFLGFLALLLISALHQRMQSTKLYEKYSMHELLLKLRKIHIARLRYRFGACR
ncbi:MAG: IS1634 family transposase [Selenomonadaceae bacterium]|nr:IS1634 family transposase [Selenomonadaceae bacterium]